MFTLLKRSLMKRAAMRFAMFVIVFVFVIVIVFVFVFVFLFLVFSQFTDRESDSINHYYSLIYHPSYSINHHYSLIYVPSNFVLRARLTTPIIHSNRENYFSLEIFFFWLFFSSFFLIYSCQTPVYHEAKLMPTLQEVRCIEARSSFSLELPLSALYSVSRQVWPSFICLCAFIICGFLV